MGAGDPLDSMSPTEARRSAEPDPPARVLIASRDSSARRWGPRWLQGHGFEVEVVKSAEQALDHLAVHGSDLVVADATLRAASGEPLCVSARRTGVPVLALCHRDREIAAVLDEGITDLIRSPFNWQLAALRARSMLRVSEVHDELKEARDRLAELERETEDDRRQMEADSRWDPLTGVLARDSFEAALRGAMIDASPAGRSVVVVLFDLDRFKHVNSTFGRSRANAILQQVAQRLTAELRSDRINGVICGSSTSAIGRIEGDLFAVMLTGVSTGANVTELARWFQDAASGEFSLGGDENVRLSTSGALAVGPRDGRTAAELLQSAEIALDRARERGGGALCSYEYLDQGPSATGTRLRTLLYSALRRGEFELHYQPLVTPDLGRICGAEALLRWNSSELGSVPPSGFIPLAEESGLMVEIGTWVLREACRQLKEWIDRGLPPIRMAVNVSLCQLTRGDLPELVRAILEETGVPASLLELEISERGSLRDDPEILVQMHELKAMDLRLSVDDFGTGNSAIAYLKRFPFDTLKIDRSFVRGVVASNHDAAITSATMAMARQLQLTIVAEGVEEDDQVEFLRKHGCSEFQGFLFSPPVPASSFEELLEKSTAAHEKVESGS